MEIHGYTESGSINATLEGVRMTVPDDPANRHRQMIAEWEAEGNTIPPFNQNPTTIEAARAAKLAEVANKRLAVEAGGITFTGVPIPTDRATAAIITSAYIKASQNPDFVVANWKVTDAMFITLDAATIIALGNAVSDHVQHSFDRNAALCAQVLALTTVDAINGFDVDAEF